MGDAGLTSTREELQGFFSDPNRYTTAVVPRMVEALVKSGKREREARRTARALELWNRALAMDPTNRDVMGELRRLETRQHLQRGGIIAAALRGAGGGGDVDLQARQRPAADAGTRRGDRGTGGRPGRTCLRASKRPGGGHRPPTARPRGSIGARSRRRPGQARSRPPARRRPRRAQGREANHHPRALAPERGPEGGR